MTPRSSRQTDPRHSAPARRWLLCCLPAAFAACDPAPDPTLSTRSDSAGIPIITAEVPARVPGQGWRVSEEPLVRIGAVEGPREQLLDGVVGAVRLSDGDIVLAEWSTGELRRYDSDGAFLWRAAGQGEGPGEHRLMRFMGSLPGDTLVTWDSGLDRVQLFGPDGGLAHIFPVETPWPRFPPVHAIGVSGRNLLIVFHDARGEVPNGVVRWPPVRIGALSLEDGSIRELIDVPGAEAHITPMGEGQGAVGEYLFGKGPRFAVSAGGLAVVDTERLSVRWISVGDGTTTRILRRDSPVQEVTIEDVDAWVEWMTALSVEQGLHLPPGLREQPMAPTLPAVKSIHLDAAGNLWVEPHSRHGAEMPPFEVYAPDGTWLGTVAVPPGLQLENRVGLPTGFEVGDDYVLGVWRDELGVEYVRVYGLTK